MTGNRFADLSKRFSISIGILFVLILIIVFAANPIVSVLLVAAVCAMAGVGVWAYAKMAMSKGVMPAIPLMVVVAVAEVLAFFIAHKWIHSPELPVLVFAAGVGLFFLNRFRKAEEALVNVAVEFFGVAYVAVPLSYMLAILYPIAPSTVADGRWWLFYLILVTKITDIGAYFGGNLLGKSKLAPEISPKKTVTGAICGFVSAVIFSFTFYLLSQVIEPFHLTLVQSLWLGALLGILGQIGDLAESLLKRDANVKDSSHLPWFGGVLDLLDSLFFTIPIIYFFLYL